MNTMGHGTMGYEDTTSFHSFLRVFLFLFLREPSGSGSFLAGFRRNIKPFLIFLVMLQASFIIMFTLCDGFTEGKLGHLILLEDENFYRYPFGPHSFDMFVKHRSSLSHADWNAIELFYSSLFGSGRMWIHLRELSLTLKYSSWTFFFLYFQNFHSGWSIYLFTTVWQCLFLAW